MKVGTDGVLLGAWADLTDKDLRILDIGTGTGLIALMAAQRTEAWGAEVVGVEIDPESATDATENVAHSPWAERVGIDSCAIQEFDSKAPFDHILSNPPYFVDSLLSPNKGRTTARHTTSLTFDELTHAASRLLSDGGALSLVLPYDAASDITLSAVRAGLFLTRRTDIKSKPTGKALRSLLEFRRTPSATLRTELTIHTPEGGFTEEYRRLTRDFYLKF